jgi:GxxExxY protein
MMTENELAKIVFEAGLKVHKTLGPGLLESAYEACLYYELRNANLLVERQKELPLWYDGVFVDAAYRLDLQIEKKVIIEVKSVRELADIHTAQLITYLKLSGNKLGLLINFNSVLFKDGFRRVIWGDLTA